MMTSYEEVFSAKNLKPSPTCTVTLGSESSRDMWGRYFLETRITAYRSSQNRGAKKIVNPFDLIDVAQDNPLDGTVLEGLANNTAVTTTDDKDFLGVWVRSERNVCNHFLVSSTHQNHFNSKWAETKQPGTYENSSRSVHWMTPSRTKTFPYVSDSKTRTSWYRLFSTCRIFLTCRVIAWPGHCDEISRNQPSGNGQNIRSETCAMFRTLNGGMGQDRHDFLD